METLQIMGKRKLETSSSEGTSETNKRHIIISSCAAASKSLSIGYATLCLLLSGALALWALQHNTHLQRRYDSTTPPHQIMQQRRLTEERRSLSIFKKKDKCDDLPQIKRMPQLPIPPTYLATYPGSGSKAARKLIMALTGLRVQSEYDTKKREDAVVTQTRYPHKAGNLVNWDGDINRAVVLIRNPLHALPGFFDELYASKKHLPLNFQAERPASSTEDNAVVGEWASWRDRMFDSQMESYREFLRYWTIDFGSRGTSPLEQRLSFFCYEDLVSEMKGSDEAARLAQFLGMLKEVSTVELNDVPCVWDMIIKKAGRALDEDGVPVPAEEAHRRRRLRSIEVHLSE